MYLDERPQSDKNAGCYYRVYPNSVAWEGVREDKEKSYSAVCVKKFKTPQQ
jgi:hypothetical protein